MTEVIVFYDDGDDGDNVDDYVDGGDSDDSDGNPRDDDGGHDDGGYGSAMQKLTSSRALPYISVRC